MVFMDINIEGVFRAALEKGAALFYYPIDFSALKC